MGNFGEVLNLVIWQIFRRSPNLINACVHMMLIIQIAKFKSYQNQMRAVLPNLMLTKIYYLNLPAIQYIALQANSILRLCIPLAM